VVQQCNTVYEQECHNEEKMHCTMHYRQECKPSYHYGQDCKSIPEQKCQYITVPNCRSVPSQRCKPHKQSKCIKVPKEVKQNLTNHLQPTDTYVVTFGGVVKQVKLTAGIN